jgi:hypothetical protein
MKKIVRKISLILMPIVASTSIVNAQGYVVHDLTTGVVNGTTTPIAYGSTDDTWMVAKPDRPAGFQTPYVCSNLNGAWGINNCGRWISPPNLDGIQPSVNSIVGTYHYKTTFNMSTLCFPWAKVNFSYIGGDNNITGFSINGIGFPISGLPPGYDFNPLTQNVTINVSPSYFLLGTNTIIIDVNNIETYTGFYACGNVSVGYCTLMSPNSNTTSSKFLKSVEAFQVFPNPSTGKFSLVLDQPAEGYANVIDLMGRKVWSSKLSTDRSNYEIDLTSLPKGIYNLSIRTGKTVQSRKIILE